MTVKDRLIRLTDGQRRTLQVVSVLLLVVGGALFVSTFVGMLFAVDPVPMGDPDWFERKTEQMGWIALRGFLGIGLLGIGGFLARFGFMKPVSEIVATETAGAIEHASGALGRGLAASGVAGGGAAASQVKVRCRDCGFLDSEDARYCSGCGAAM